MEDLLPLLIGIIWLAFTWYNKDQKKKRRAAQSTGKQKPEKKEPSILEQILMGQEIETDQPDIAYNEPEMPVEIDKIKAEKAPDTRIRYPFLHQEISEYDEEGESSLIEQDDMSVYMSESSDESEYGNNMIFNLQSIDLKKVVVYSEILNPPYIDYK